MIMTDFYEELNLDRSKSTDQINEALSKLESTWKRREITNPEKATKMLALIIDARKVFASDAARRSYDNDLQRSKSKPEPVDPDRERAAELAEWKEKATFYLSDQQYDLAKIAVEKALSLANDADDSLCALAANIYEKTNALGLALDWINKAIVLAPDVSAYYITKGLIYDHKGSLAVQRPEYGSPAECHSEARKIFQRASVIAENAGDLKTKAIAYGALAFSYYFQDPMDKDQGAKYAEMAAASGGDLWGNADTVLKEVNATREEQKRKALEEENARKQKIYLEAAELACSNEKATLEKAIATFETIHDYKDSARQIDQVKEKIHKITATERKASAASVLYVISWIVLLANVLFCLVPFIRSGSFVYSDSILYGMNYKQILFFGLASGALMCFATNFGAKGYLGTVFGWIWSFIICFGVATIRYTQAGFNAASASNTWKFFGILIAVFVAVLFASAKLGAVARVGSSAIRPRSKPKFHACDVLSLFVLIGTTAAGIVLLQDLDRFYFWTKNYNLFDIGVWVITIAFFFVFSSSLKRNEIVDAWFFAAMTVLFDCALLTIGAFGLILSVVLGLVILMMAVGFVGMIAQSKNIAAFVTIALVVVLFIADFNIVIRLWSGPGRVGEGLRWWITAPVILDAVVAAGFSVVVSI